MLKGQVKDLSELYRAIEIAAASWSAAVLCRFWNPNPSPDVSNQRHHKLANSPELQPDKSLPTPTDSLLRQQHVLVQNLPAHAVVPEDQARLASFALHETR